MLISERGDNMSDKLLKRQNLSFGFNKEIAVTHEMNLNPEPFESIKTGRKNVEMRLNDERRKGIKKGDFIRFTHTETGEKLLVRVEDKLVYPSFNELYLAHDKTTIGYGRDDVAHPDDMLKYYTEEKIKEYGALAIVISLV